MALGADGEVVGQVAGTRGRSDPLPPGDRAIAFLDELEKAMRGREGEIGTLTGSLRRFEWKRRTADRIWVAASDYQIAAEADDDGKVHVIGKRHPHEAGGLPGRELMAAPEMSEVTPALLQRGRELQAALPQRGRE